MAQIDEFGGVALAPQADEFGGVPIDSPEPQADNGDTGGVGYPLPPEEAHKKAVGRMYDRNVAAGKTDLLKSDDGEVGTADSRLLALGLGATSTSSSALSDLALAGEQKLLEKSGVISPETGKAGGAKAFEQAHPDWYQAGQLIGAVNPRSLGNLAFKKLAPQGAEGLVRKFLGWMVPGAVTGGAQGALDEAASSVEKGLPSGETLKRSAKAGAKGAAIGAVASGILGSAIPTPARVSEAVGQADAIKEAEAQGIPLTMADAAQSPMLAKVEKVLQMIPFSAGTMNKAAQRQLSALRGKAEELVKNSALRNNLLEDGDTAALETVGTKIQGQIDDLLKSADLKTDAARSDMRNQILDEIGSPHTFEQMDQEGQAVLAHWQAAKRTAADEMFNAVREVDPGKNHAIDLTASAAKSIKSLIPKEGGFRPSSDTMAKIESLAKTIDPKAQQLMDSHIASLRKQNFSEDLIKKMLPDIEKQYPLKRSINEVLNIRTMLNDAIKTQGFDSHEAGMLRTLRNSIDSDLQKISDKTGGDLSQYLDQGLKLTRERKEFMTLSSVKSLQNDTAKGFALSKVVAPNNAAQIQEIGKVLGPQAKDLISKAMGNRLFDVGEKTATEDIAHGVRTNLNKYGEETVDAAMGRGSFQKLHKAADQFEAMDLKKGVENPLFRSLLEQSFRVNPQKVADKLIQPNNTGNAFLIAKTLGEDSRKAVAQAWLKNQLGLNPNTLTTPTNITALSAKYGEPTLRAWLGNDVVSEWNQLNKVALRMSAAERFAANTSGTGQAVTAVSHMERVMRGLFLAVAGGSAAFGHLGSAGASIGIPVVAARLYTNPRTLKLFRLYLENVANDPNSIGRGAAYASLLRSMKGQDN